MPKLTIKDVAREAGVSTATVSRVLNRTGYVSDEVKRQVLNIVKKLNYQPNAIARSLKQEKTRSIGLVLPDMTNPYFMQIARSIQKSVVAGGYHLLIMDSEEQSEVEKEALNFLQEKRVEAIVLAAASGNEEQVCSIHESGTLVVLVDRNLPGLQLDTVAEDNMLAARMAAAHLLAGGHRHIAVINGPLSISTASERRQGFIEGLAEAGVIISDEYWVQGDYTKQSGKKAIQYLLELPVPPTAVFSANNEMTLGLYLGLQELGVPLDRIEVVSIGDLEFSSLFQHKLTVIRQHPEAIGEAVGDMVLKRLQNKDTGIEYRTFTPILVPKQ